MDMQKTMDRPFHLKHDNSDIYTSLAEEISNPLSDVVLGFVFPFFIPVLSGKTWC